METELNIKVELDCIEKTKHYFKIFNEMVDLFEFKIEKTNEGFQLVDLQGANLGDIEAERFTNIVDMIDRLTIYIEGYIIDDICDELSMPRYSFMNYKDLYNKMDKSPDFKKNHKFDTEVLDMIINASDFDFFYDENIILKYLKYDTQNETQF